MFQKISLLYHITLLMLFFFKVKCIVGTACKVDFIVLFKYHLYLFYSSLIIMKIACTLKQVMQKLLKYIN